MRPDTFIRKSNSWNDFFHRLEALKPKEKGDIFERVVQLYLRTHPEYQSTLSEVWMLDEVPGGVREKLNLPNLDEGIDLIAKTQAGRYWAIQAKFRSNPDSRLTNKGDLATFTSLAFHTCKNIDYGLICATTSLPLKKVNLTGEKTGFRLFSDFQALDDDDGWGWKRLVSALGKSPIRPKKLRPMWHQKRAIKSAYSHFVESEQARGKMIMPCGTGKSLTGFWIAQRVDAKRIVIAVPSLALVKQTLNVWTREFLAHKVTPDWICVCSDAGSGEVDGDEFTAHIYDLGVPCTTDSDEIATFLNKRGHSPRIVFTTYQSGPALAEGAAKAHRSFDLGIMDEAHKTVGRKNKIFAHLLHDENLKIQKRLFMTATERQFIGASDEIASMDDPELYGETFELLTFKEAIGGTQPIICDYKLVTIGIAEQEIRDLWEDNKYLQISSDKLDEVATRSLAAGLALRKAYTKFKIKRAISFHGSIQKAENFKQQQEAITDVFPELARVECHHVSSRIPTSKRATILREFAETKRGLITNARCLTEGVDIPSVDCVLFADPRRSIIDIVQAAGRAMRRAENKKFGYIIVPMVVPQNVDIDEFSKETGFKEVVRTIRPLAASDDRIVEYFRGVSEGKNPNSDGPIIIDCDVVLPQKIDETSFANSLNLRIWDRVAKLNWRPFGEARQFARSLDLSGNTEWRAYIKSGQLPPDIPTTPERNYRELGWKNWGDWLGTSNIAPQLITYRSFEEARNFARSKEFLGQREWRTFVKSSDFPPDIPATPPHVYKHQGWQNWGDWLGTDFVATYARDYRDFRNARKYARGLKLRNSAEWFVFSKSDDLPSDIPANPNRAYRDAGWTSFGDWLGTGIVANRNKKFRSFKVARKFVQSLKFKSATEWRNFARSGDRPPDIPTNPNTAYKEEWISWADWLGSGNVSAKLRKFRSFSKARKFVRSFKLRNESEWIAFTKSKIFPKDLPVGPRHVYQNKGWKGLGDWLGTGTIAPSKRQFRNFGDARKFVRALNLKNQADWFAYTKSGELPADIPVAPSATYKDKGWNGYGDWLGTETIYVGFRSFRTFSDARKFARSLNLKTTTEWYKFIKSGNLPKDIPTNPQQKYRDQGWSSWGDWLGKAKQKQAV